MNTFNTDTFDRMQINLTMFDDADSLPESHTSSSKSSFSYADPMTPSGSSRRPSTNSMDWESQYLSLPCMISQHRIGQTLPYCNSSFSPTDPLLALESQIGYMQLASEMPFLRDCLMTNDQSDEHDTMAIDDMFIVPAQMSRWEHSELLIEQNEMSEAVSASKCFTTSTLNRILTETDYPPVYESIETIQPPVQSVLPSQTVTIPLRAKQDLADPPWTPIKSEPSGSLAYNILPSSPLSNTYAEHSSSISEHHGSVSPTVSDYHGEKSPEKTGREARLAALKKRVGIHENYPCRVFPRPSKANECNFNVSPEGQEEKPCGKRFKRKEHLKRHIKTVHKVQETIFQCDIPKCSKAFNRSDNLKQHIQKTHLKASPTSRNRRLKSEEREQYLSSKDSRINKQTCRRAKL